MRGGYRFAPGQDVSLTPSLELSYARIDQHAFEERGGAGALSVDSRLTESVRSQLGTRFAALLSLGAGGSLEPSLYVGCAHELGDTERRVSAHLRGIDLASFGSDDSVPTDTVLVEMGLRAGFGERLDAFLAARGEYADRYRAERLSAGIEVRF